MSRPSLSDLLLVLGAMVIAAAMSFAAEDGATPANIVFGSILVLILLVGLRSAVRATRRAVAQRHEAIRLASMSPTDAVLQAVRAESERLYADIHGTLRVALDAISDSASRAHELMLGKAPADIEQGVEELRAIQHHGRVATTELRRMLGLLRADRHPAPHQVANDVGEEHNGHDSQSQSRQSDIPAWPPKWGWLVVCGLLLAQFVIFAVAWDGGLAHAGGQTVLRAVTQIMLTCLAAVVFLLPVETTVANSMTAAVFALGLVLDAPVVLDVWAILTFSVLTWRTFARSARQPWATLSFAVLVAVVLFAEARVDIENFWFIAVFFVIAAFTALIARFADGTHAAARQRAQSAEQAISASTDEALRMHRLAIGRDLHDALSGAIGVIVAQAGAAEMLLPTAPDRAADALNVITASIENARVDLDHLATLEGNRAGTVRGLAEVPELIARLRSAGLDVQVTPELPAIQGDANAAAYWIIQECLSNAALHSPGSSVEVSVAANDGWLQILVADDGRGRASTSRGGLGLLGLRERAKQLGGEVNIHADVTGFRVTADLPLKTEEFT